MLSLRGTLTIDAVLNECIGRSGVTQSFGSSLSPLRQANSVIPLTEAQAVWTALGTFLRNQMLLGHPITIPKFCSFWCRQRHVATQGNVNFYVREVCFGFAQSFVTTYNLNPMVSLEDPKIKFLKVPLDLIAQEARVPADVCASVLKEVALFVGEGTFNGKSFNLNFPTVLDVQLKKERTFVSPCSSLVNELLAIDTRKWPADMREVAAAVVLRPVTASSAVSASSSRSRSRAGSVTGTAQSRPSTRGSSAAGGRRTASSAAGRPHTSSSTHDAGLVPPRPLFVTAVTQNKTFAEIEKAPAKEIRHVPRLPGAKGRELIKALRSGGVAGAPSGGGGHRHVDPLAPQALLAPSSSSPYHNSAIEEESVYDVLSPSRRVAAAINNAAMNHQDGGRRNQTHFDRDDEHINSNHNFYDDHNYGEDELHDPVDYGLHNNDDGDHFGGGEDYENTVAPPPALFSTAAPPSAAPTSRIRFPLADRTSTENSTHNRVFGESTANNAIVAGKKRIMIQEPAVVGTEATADQNERNAQRHDARVPSRSHATRPPWHTDEEDVVERDGRDFDAAITTPAAACERFRKRRIIPSNDAFVGNYQNQYQQVPQQQQQRAPSSGGARRHFEHPAEKTHIKDLLYENTYFMK